jgi:hypothetical protein
MDLNCDEWALIECKLRPDLADMNRLYSILIDGGAAVPKKRPQGSP